ncbi:MAG TPA: hypothetical protein PKK48_07675 [Phycisphaerae bacterium]|nr:hypothetical protein [Phycisphaerae bacterium]
MKMSILTVTLVVAAALISGGCKKVQTTFVNTTTEPLELTVNGPGLGVGNVGTIPAGGQLTTLIQVSPVWLPTTYTFTAGSHEQSFSLTDDCKDRIWIAIPEGAKIDIPSWQEGQGLSQVGDPAPVSYNP